MNRPLSQSTEVNPRWLKAQQAKLSAWKVPRDTWNYLIERRLIELVGTIVDSLDQDPVFVAVVLGHALWHAQRKLPSRPGFSYERIYHLFVFGKQQKLYDEILKLMVPFIYEYPTFDFEMILQLLRYHRCTMAELTASVPGLRKRFAATGRKHRARAEANWMMSQLRSRAIGNVCMEELRRVVDAEVLGRVSRHVR